MHLILPLLLLSLLGLSTSASLPKHKPAAQHKAFTSSNKSPSQGPKKANPNPKQQHQQQQKQKQQAKYFHEAGATMELGHYDARFFRGAAVGYGAHGRELRRLVRSWLATAGDLGVGDGAWLAHGTLLGWWWGGRAMPWDYDLDVQMPADTLAYLGRHFNGTVHEFRFEGEGGEGGQGGEAYVNKTYLLDVNPHHADLDRGNGANLIDARWIDTGNGLFVDITGLAERDPVGAPGVWSCKNAHRYRTTELFPVRRTEFEGVPARVPYAFEKILADEYGEKSLVATEWAGHRWEPKLNEWVKISKSPTGKKEKETTTSSKQHEDAKAVVVVVEKTVVKGGS